MAFPLACSVVHPVAFLNAISLLKNGTGSEPISVFCGNSTLRRGACPIFQRAAMPENRLLRSKIQPALLLGLLN